MNATLGSNLLIQQQNAYRYQRVPSFSTKVPELDWLGKRKQVVSTAAGDIEQGDDAEERREQDAEDEESHEQRQKRSLAELKTTVFDTYAICAALLASFACSTNFISEAELLKETPWRRYIVQGQQVLVRVCIIGGIHAMLVFMFCALYAKSALARENYGLPLYDRFSAQTGGIRQTAFWVMYYTAVLYSVQIAMTTVYSLPWFPAVSCAVILIALIGRVVWDCQTVIKTAGCVFMSEAQVRAMLEEMNQKK